MTSRETKHSSDLGTIKLIYVKKTGTLTYMQRGGYQSAVDRRGVSLDTYIHAIYGLVLQTTAKNILMIGCGGGTLGRMLTAAGRKLTIVDIDETSFKIAKAHFGLPKSITCHVGDGLAYMQKTRKKFDAVIIDAFVGEKIPPQFTSDDFCKAARRCLHDAGAMYINVCLFDKKDPRADSLALRLRKNGWKARLFDQRGGARNGIVIAGEVRRLRRPELLLVPDAEAAKVRRELRGSRFRPVISP
jgi:spermidine synthase